MIISTEKNFTFIHIPKNAGSNIREVIKKYDKYHGDFNSFIVHPLLGETHSGHLTLSEIERNYPIQYREILDSVCFTVLRNPHDRFISALSQRLREFKNFLPVEVTQDNLAKEAREVLSLIQGKSSEELPVELIHFRKQIDYIFDQNGNQVVKNIFDIKNIPSIFDWLNSEFSLDIVYIDDQIKQNATMEIKNPFIKIFSYPFLIALKPLINKIPNTIKHNIKVSLIKFGIYGRSDSKSIGFYEKNLSINKMVKDYYHEDIALYHSVSNLNLISA